MSDMSFRQAKELTEQFELAELTLSQTLKRVERATDNFDRSLVNQEKIISLVPKTDKKLNNMKIVVALNIGFIIGLIVSKYLL